MKPIRRATPVGDRIYTRHPGSVWIDNNRGKLKNNFWVAANESGLIADDRTIDGLVEKLNNKNFNLRNVAVAYISSDPI